MSQEETKAEIAKKTKELLPNTNEYDQDISMSETVARAKEAITSWKGTKHLDISGAEVLKETREALVSVGVSNVEEKVTAPQAGVTSTTLTDKINAIEKSEAENPTQVSQYNS